MNAIKVTWPKVRKALRDAESIYLYSDGSLLLKTVVNVRGAKAEVWTHIAGYVPAWHVDIYSGHNSMGTHRARGLARVVFFSRCRGNLGYLTLARPKHVEAFANNCSENSDAAGIGGVGIHFYYDNGIGLTHEYLSTTRDESAHGVTTFNSYLVCSDLELQVGLDDAHAADAYGITERWTLASDDE